MYGEVDKSAVTMNSTSISALPMVYYLNERSDNTSESNSIYPAIILSFVNLCILVIGLVGNTVTCIVIGCSKSMHTTTNCYLFNLAISDMLLLIAGIPFDIFSSWSIGKGFFGNNWCFFIVWISEASINVSILTITAFTVERYLAICRPFVAHVMSQIPRAIKLIAFIWIVAFSFAYNIARQMYMPNDKLICLYEDSIPYLVEIMTGIFFFAPMTIITILYIFIGIHVVKSSKISRTRGYNEVRNFDHQSRQSIDPSTKRVLKMLVAVVSVFFICWAPFHIQRLITIYALEIISLNNWNTYTMVNAILFYFTGVFYFFSAAINPIIYSLMSHKFRDAFKETFSKFYQTFCCCTGQLKFSTTTAQNGNDTSDDTAVTRL